MANAKHDDNRNTTLIGVSSVDLATPTNVSVNPTTGALLVDTSSGTTADVNLAEVGGASFSLGQQLAASSLPVVLTASQLSTLTPLSTVAVTQTTSPWVISGAVTNTVLSVVGGGVEATAQRVTLASDSTGILTVKQATAANLNMTEASASGILTSVQLIDDVIYTSGDTLSKTAGIAAQFDDVSPGAMTENKMGPVRMSSRREIYTTIRDAAGNERGANVDSNNNLGVVLAAETTKVLGVTRTADGAGNLLTSNSTTYTAKFGLDVNVLGTLGTAFSTAGKVDVKGADGDVFVRQSTATNLKTQAEAYQGGSAVAAGNPLQVTLANGSVPSHAVTIASGGVASGAISSGAVASGAFASGSVASGAFASGSLASGAMVDITNVSMPITPATATATKTLGLGAEYRSTLPTWTNTQQGALQVGTRGSLHVELWNTDSATPVPSGSGTATGAVRVELANNGTGVLATVGAVTAITNALPAGTNAIGKLAANSGVDIGDVDVTSIAAGDNNIGNVDIVTEVTTALDHGSNRDIDTTAEQITSTSYAAKFGVLIKASPLNTGTVYIGNSDVTAGTTDATDGFPLLPGETVLIKVNNANIPYAIGSANNQIVYWFAV